jgi:hypothetical protein
VPGLFAGNYAVTFSAAGMKKFQTVVPLQYAQVAVLNAKLTVGDVAEQVTVSTELVQLATYDSGTVSTQLESSRIDQLLTECLGRTHLSHSPARRESGATREMEYADQPGISQRSFRHYMSGNCIIHRSL